MNQGNEEPFETEDLITLVKATLLNPALSKDERESLQQHLMMLESVRGTDTSRNKRWVDVSQKFVHFKRGYAVITIQGLGKLDAKLSYEDQKYVKHGKSSSPIGDMGDHLTLSYLWVLGAYELVRTFAQESKNTDYFFPHHTDQINAVKKKLARPRMIFAKNEPASGHKDTDASFAMPGYNLDHGVAWHVAEDTWITRQELSDAVLDLFEQLPKWWPNQP